jgi:hypothetical protein
MLDAQLAARAHVAPCFVMAFFSAASCQLPTSAPDAFEAGQQDATLPLVSASPASTQTPFDAAPMAVANVDHPFHGPAWTACTNGFRTSNQPQRDVTRLSLSCAPYQGMRRFGRTFFHRATPSSPGSFSIRLATAQCARVFVTADNQVHSFRVSILDSQEAIVGYAQSRSSPFAVANESGAFCVPRTGEYRIRIDIEQGSGLIAAEVWTLPPP